MTLVVSLSAIKLALGIEDDSEDALLTALEARAATWVEGETSRRFERPEETIEFRDGTGTRTLYLNGHADDEDPSIEVRLRPFGGDADDWEDLEQDTDFEFRKDKLIRTDGRAWTIGYEYEITYEDGYTIAPADIQALIIELVGLGRASTTAIATGAGDIKSETFGPYSYTVDTTGGSASVITTQSLTDTGAATLARWKRMRV